MKKDEWIIEVQHVSYTYEGNDKKSLDNVSLKIKRGQKIAFMGGNGSGKSTLFLCMNGIIKPERGKIIIDGQPVGYKRKELLEVRKKLGIVFQEPDNQLFSASVYQEISFGILNLGVSEEQARQEVEKVIEELEITPFEERPAHALSGGQKKQVAIADILVMHPEIIILDEPAAALDVKHKKMIEKIMERLTRKGITVLIATHDIDYAWEWADKIILMKDGQVIGQGPPEEICRDRHALGEAELEPPSVLRFYEKLLETGLIPPAEGSPKSFRELEEHLTALHCPDTKREKGEASCGKRNLSGKFWHKPS